MNLWQRLTLQIIKRVNNPALDLALLPLLRQQLGQSEPDIRTLAVHPAWQARWVAAQKAAAFLVADEAWSQLCQLAQDPERNVREGAAHGLGDLLHRHPQLFPRYQTILSTADSAEKVREAVLRSLVIVWRHHPEQLDLALELLTIAASQPLTGPYRTIGSQLLGVELPKFQPQMAQNLRQDWAAAENIYLQYHAARANGTSAKAAKQLVGLVEATMAQPFGSLGQSPSALLRTGLTVPENWLTTADILTPPDLLSQVIGQQKAVEIVRLAAQQRRFVLMIGEAGTGKSMLASAMAQMLPAAGVEDILALPNPQQPISPLIQPVPGGTGQQRVEQIREARQHAQTTVKFMWWVFFIGLGVAGGVLSYTQSGYLYPLGTIIILVALLWLRPRLRLSGEWVAPKLLVHNPSEQGAPFVDATGFHAGALLGDVRHDPFQSGGRESPPHHLVEAGAIHLAHKGVLFIDEVSTLSMESQQKLLTAIQEKQLPITGRSLGSSGSMVRTGPVPCDFVLVLAGNMEDVEKMHPALRSRIRGYGYEIVTASDMPDTPENRMALSQFVGQEVRKDGKIPHLSRAAVETVIAEAARRATKPDHLSLRLRELGGLVRAAGDLAVSEGVAVVEAAHVIAALEITKSLEEQLAGS